MTTRRDFLVQGAASAALLGMPAAALAQPRGRLLEAREASVQLAPSGYPETGIWGYDGRIPGPELRARQGSRLAVTLSNALPQPTSVHWHGLRIDNAMDGVAGLTQEAVPKGASFDYEFALPDAGTFWYHAHNRSVEQVARGLHGPLIVDEPVPPDVDRDETLVLDDWLLDPETVQFVPDFEASHDRSHAGRRGNLVTTNGRYGLSVDCRKNERLRLRLINAANARIFVLGLSGLEGWTVAFDGMPLERPEPVSGELILGPGQRADLIVDVTAEEGGSAQLLRMERQGGVSQVAFAVSGTASAARRPAPAALPPNPGMQVPGLDEALRARLHMAGGAMGSLQQAVLRGEEKSIDALVEANEFWAFNGTVGMTDAPLLTASRGQTVRLEVFNDTAFPHAMHLHGMHFREVMKEGGVGPLRDTLFTIGGETREIAFVADNPGDWLFHCHMLSHAASGMMTWMKVTA